jgi:hypothetical protein
MTTITLKETLKKLEALSNEKMCAQNRKNGAYDRWSLTSERIDKSPEGLDLPVLLERIESEMGVAAPEVQ